MTPQADTLSPSAYLGHLTNGDPTKASAIYKPTHPGFFEVQFRDGEYNSCLVALREFAKGETIAFMNHATPSNAIRYSTVQVSENDHIELNSDLLYCNHSCSPSVRFNISCPRNQWRAEALRDIQAGDILEFFYPSTEWNMSQPFDCSCGSKSCLKRISGAKHIPANVLRTYVVNDHIRRLKSEQGEAL
ncbi:hypothetical protein CBS101457_003265 [Exobasidium rhododendri]|nr:hypothetical protein CBS101457_003265 [Exobasidium rhododendri]